MTHFYGQVDGDGEPHTVHCLLQELAEERREAYELEKNLNYVVKVLLGRNRRLADLLWAARPYLEGRLPLPEAEPLTLDIVAELDPAGEGQ